MQIDICLCTFRRASVAETLRSIEALRQPAGCALRVIVVDNDAIPSAQDLVAKAADSMSIEVRYVHAPAGNIALARNAALEVSDAGWLAFIDDDEQAAPDWLMRLIECQRTTNVDAVFGPSVALYAKNDPDWISNGDFHSQPVENLMQRLQTGHSCNALLRWRGTSWQAQRFDLSYGRTGGEDTEFFLRLRHLGCRFGYCKEAIVYEPVSPERASLRWLAGRRFRVGQICAELLLQEKSRFSLALWSFAKCLFCGLGLVFRLRSKTRRCRWTLRGCFHLGVLAGCVGLKQSEVYGAKQQPVARV